MVKSKKQKPRSIPIRKRLPDRTKRPVKKERVPDELEETPDRLTQDDLKWLL